ncbi:MAG: GH25 family lysozyme, partial [Candidatus Methylumidiphilus sp.]
MAAQLNPIAAIDVSKWQGRIDWDKVKRDNPHIKLVAIKAGGGDDGVYADVQFKRNWAEAKRVGFDRMAYWFA